MSATGDGDVVPDSLEIVSPDGESDHLSARGRYETAYIGRWAEGGRCEAAEHVWTLTPTSVASPKGSCTLRGLIPHEGKIQTDLHRCGPGGPVANLDLDLSGERYLWIDTGADRFRVERCLES